MSDHIQVKQRSKLYHYAALVTDVYDGDTLTVDIDLGIGLWRRGQKIRLWKVDTPELRGDERPEGERVRDFVRGLVLGKTVLLRTILDKRGQDQTGKFGRLLGEVLTPQAEGEPINLNQLLIERGMARGMGEDGSPLDTLPSFGAPGQPPDTIACPYCGERRAVDPVTLIVAFCPNCLDDPFPLG